MTRFCHLATLALPMLVAVSPVWATEQLPTEGWVSLDPAAASRAPVVAADPLAHGLLIQVGTPGFGVATQEVPAGVFRYLGVPSAGATATIGHPELPMVSRYIEVPAGASLEIEPTVATAATYQLRAEVRVWPVQPPATDSGDRAETDFTLDAATYARDAWYPSSPYDVEGPIRIRDRELYIIRSYPLRYNPARGMLRATEDLRLQVTWTGAAADAGRSSRLRSSTYDALVDRLALNTLSESGGPAPDPASRVAGSMVVVTVPELVTAADTLAAWKNRRGLATTVVTTDDTGTTADDILAYLQNAYDTWDPAPEAVLLLGDAELIPPFYETYHSYHGFDIGTDLYYGTLDGDDLFADVSLGRISVDTLAEAQKRVADIVRYERDPPALETFYESVAIATYFQDDNRNGMADRRFSQTSEDLALYLDKDFDWLSRYSVDRIYYTQNAVDPQEWGYWFSGGPAGNMGQPIPDHLLKPDFAWRGNKNHISDAVNAGRFLVTHRDHGTRWGWDSPYYHDTQVTELSNGELLPVVLSINCETGWFDNETDPADWTSDDAVHFSETWERNPDGGAIGVVAATRVSYSGYNDRLAWGLFDALWPGFVSDFNGGSTGLQMGAVLNSARAYLATTYGAGTTRDLTFEIFHWFGDPTTSMWTRVPENLVVDHAAEVAAGATSIEVTVSRKKALVAVTRDGEILGTAKTTSNGETIAVSLAAGLDAGDVLDVVVTRTDYRPYEGQVEVAALSSTIFADDLESGDCSAWSATEGEG